MRRLKAYTTQTFACVVVVVAVSCALKGNLGRVSVYIPPCLFYTIASIALENYSVADWDEYMHTLCPMKWLEMARG